MPLLVVLALIVVPIVELYVIVQVGQGIGVLPTLALLVVMSLVGGFLLRREGRRTWGALTSALQAGRVPAKEVADGALVVLGGALLLTPGFATDAFGLLCILPPSRAVLRRLLTGVVAKRLRVGGLVGGGLLSGGLLGGGSGGPRTNSRRRQADGRVVDGEVVDEGPPPDPGRPTG